MQHLSTEELLLLADGETSPNGAEHFDACVECQERLGALQGELTAVSSALTSAHRHDDNSAQSWARLEQAISQESAARDLHLSPEELLLLIDGELSPTRAGHAGRCSGCGSAQHDVQQLLSNLESDLRALVPSEPMERRMAAEQALKQHLYRAENRKVIAFPTPRLARYAAAAALLISAFAGYQVWNQSPQSEVRVLTAETILPQPVVAPAVVRPEIEPQGLIAVEPEPVVQVSTTARFEFVAGSVAAEPAEQAIIAQLPTVQLERFETATADFAFELLPAVSRPAAAVPVRPVFTEEIEAPGVVGGLVRTALVEHYRDAARRSFRSADAPALDAEIARYVSEVFRGQNDLVAHAYELNQLLNGPAALDHSAKQVRSHVNGALESEAVIYGHLSEALPRRYWRSQGDADSTESSSDPRVESRELLRDVLGLERTLTTVLTGSQQTVDFEDARLSSGDLLRRIHERLGRIKELTRSSL